MKKIHIVIALAIVLILILGVIAISKISQNNPILIRDNDKVEYCYDTKMGARTYYGTDEISKKYCICDGKEINMQPCPKGTACDSTTIFCKGKILGYKFGWGLGKNGEGFENMDEWKNFCNTLSGEERENCFVQLDEAKPEINSPDNTTSTPDSISGNVICGKTDPLYCENDSDCICADDSTQYPGCFTGNKAYYKKCEDKSQSCTDHCRGWGQSPIKCVSNKCSNDQNRKVGI